MEPLRTELLACLQPAAREHPRCARVRSASIAIKGHQQLGVVQGAQVDREASAPGTSGLPGDLVHDAARTLARETSVTVHGRRQLARPGRPSSGCQGDPSSSSAKQKESLPGLPNALRGRPRRGDRRRRCAPPAGGRGRCCHVGAVALTEDVVARLHADRATNRTVHHDHGAHRHGGGEQPVHVEGVGAGGLDGGEDHRQVLGLAAGHDGVDRRPSRRCTGPGPAGRPRPPRRALRVVPLEHGHHALLGGRHQRESVGPPAGEDAPRTRPPAAGELDPARTQLRATEAHGQLGERGSGSTRERAAAGAPVSGRLRAQPRDTRVSVSHSLAMPAERALPLDTALDPQQRRHGLDAPVAPRGLASALSSRGSKRLPGNRRIVLAVDGDVRLLARAATSTGATSSQVGQSRFTTATRPSGSSGREVSVIAVTPQLRSAARIASTGA